MVILDNKNNENITVDKIEKDKMKVTVYNISPKTTDVKPNIERDLFNIFKKYENT